MTSRAECGLRDRPARRACVRECSLGVAAGTAVVTVERHRRRRAAGPAASCRTLWEQEVWTS